MPYVLTDRFNEDKVEEYFGQQRCMDRRSDNPTIQQFSYNANIICTQRFVSTRTENTSAKYKGLKTGLPGIMLMMSHKRNDKKQTSLENK